MGGAPLFARIGHQWTVPGFKYKTIIINDISERILALICSVGFWCVCSLLFLSVLLSVTIYLYLVYSVLYVAHVT